jgi:hypothetical protein
MTKFAHLDSILATAFQSNQVICARRPEATICWNAGWDFEGECTEAEQEAYQCGETVMMLEGQLNEIDPEWIIDNFGSYHGYAEYYGLPSAMYDPCYDCRCDGAHKYPCQCDCHGQ